MQGLWGPGSPFADFKAFLDSMKSRGVSFLEMLAMEMKSEGYYVARGLSFTSAPFEPCPQLDCPPAPVSGLAQDAHSFQSSREAGLYGQVAVLLYMHA